MGRIFIDQPPQHLKRLPDAGQHAQRKHIDLHQAQRINIILVPLDECAILHRGIVNGNSLIQPVLGQHETTDMLRQVPRKIEQSLDEMVQSPNLRIVWIKATFGKALGLHGRRIAPPDGGGEPRRHIFAQAQGLTDFTHGTARAIMDDRRHNPGAVAAIAFIDILHHLLAPLMLKIDVNIGRFAPFF